MAVDPVCGMQVDEKTAVAKTAYRGQTYHFCWTRCKERFEEDPEKFLVELEAHKRKR